MLTATCGDSDIALKPMTVATSVKICLTTHASMARLIDDRPFTIRRVAKPGTSLTKAPGVVSCT